MAESYAAYEVIFIVLAVLWSWWIDGQKPDLRDWVGNKEVIDPK